VGGESGRRRGVCLFDATGVCGCVILQCAQCDDHSRRNILNQPAVKLFNSRYMASSQLLWLVLETGNLPFLLESTDGKALHEGCIGVATASQKKGRQG